LLYVALRVVWMNDSFGFWHWVGFGGCSLVNALVYWWIASLATPTYDATGDLIDGGADLNTHGNLSEYEPLLQPSLLTGVVTPKPSTRDCCCARRYAFDVVYIVVFVQLTTIISEYFWFILLVVSTLPPSLASFSISLSLHAIMLIPASSPPDPGLRWVQAARPCPRWCTCCPPPRRVGRRQLTPPFRRWCS